MTPFVFVLATLAVWRVTHLFVAEDGPFDLLVRLRRAVGSSVFGSLLDCFYCMSLWVAIPLALWMGQAWAEKAVLWLALSAAAILVHRVIERVAPEMPVYEEAREIPKGEQDSR